MPEAEPNVNCPFIIVEELNVEVEFAVNPPLKICAPVHVGVIDCESAGAESLLKNVLAVPFIAARPICADGLAPVEVEYPESFEKNPRLLGIVKVCVAPDEVIVNVEAAVVVANVCDDVVNPFRLKIVVLALPQSNPVPDTTPAELTRRH